MKENNLGIFVDWDSQFSERLQVVENSRCQSTNSLALQVPARGVGISNRLPQFPYWGEGPHDSWLRKIRPTHKRINAYKSLIMCVYVCMCRIHVLYTYMIIVVCIFSVNWDSQHLAVICTRAVALEKAFWVHRECAASTCHLHLRSCNQTIQEWHIVIDCNAPPCSVYHNCLACAAGIMHAHRERYSFLLHFKNKVGHLGWLGMCITLTASHDSDANGEDEPGAHCVTHHVVSNIKTKVVVMHFTIQGIPSHTMIDQYWKRKIQFRTASHYVREGWRSQASKLFRVSYTWWQVSSDPARVFAL